MSLYSNILSYKRSEKSADEKPANSNASMKFLQDHLAAKQRSKQNATSKETPNKPKDMLKPRQVVSVTSLHKPSENDWDPDEEYDPMLPNSYEVLQAQHLKMREQELQNRSGKLAVPDMLEMLDKLESEEAFEEQEAVATTKKTKGTAIAPPPVLGGVTNGPPVNSSASAPIKEAPVKQVSSQNKEKSDGTSVAVKIMAKMGYKAGLGLGKDEQGMSKPLEVEKSGTNMGKILSEPAKFVCPQPPAEKEEANIHRDEYAREATRVLLLQNMVGPGEVDDDLDAETKEECKKYGSVIRCVIYEIPNKKVADDEAVRIFVEFRQVESAIKAMLGLNGKYFGGRIVRASFYDVNKFNKFELAPS